MGLPLAWAALLPWIVALQGEQGQKPALPCSSLLPIVQDNCRSGRIVHHSAQDLQTLGQVSAEVGPQLDCRTVASGIAQPHESAFGPDIDDQGMPSRLIHMLVHKAGDDFQPRKGSS